MQDALYLTIVIIIYRELWSRIVFFLAFFFITITFASKEKPWNVLGRPRGEAEEFLFCFIFLFSVHTGVNVFHKAKGCHKITAPPKNKPKKKHKSHFVVKHMNIRIDNNWQL